jgi:DNA topoisomerase-2
VQEAVLQNMKLDLKKLANKVRFIRCVVNNEIVVSNRKRADLFLELRQKNFDPFPKKKKTAEPAAVGAIEEEEVEESPEAANEVDASDYEYLLSMAIGTLTLEKMQELNAQKDKVVNEIEELQNTSEKSLWLRDLDTFEKDLEVSNASL